MRVEDWGCVESDEGGPGRPPSLPAPCRERPRDWKKIRPVKMESDGMGLAPRDHHPLRGGPSRRRLGHPHRVQRPLSLARKLSGDRLNYDLKENTPLVEDALEAVTETILAFMEACFREGGEGIFYSCRRRAMPSTPRRSNARFGEPHDRRILQTVREHSRLTVLHAHGERLMFDRLAGPPRGCVELGTIGARDRPLPKARRW
jgi:hypothetical protein